VSRKEVKKGISSGSSNRRIWVFRLASKLEETDIRKGHGGREELTSCA